MQDPVGPVRIALGAIVLDTPDRSGCYVAKDLVGGWAYLVSDGDGDHRFRGEGYCPGGIDMALRWALLAALTRVPECRQIKLLVDNRETHRTLVRLAQIDDPVIAGIGGRPLKVLTRPEERSVRRATNAAEQAASVVLRERARREAVEQAIEVAAQQATMAIAARDVLADAAMDLREWRVERTLPSTQRLQTTPVELAKVVQPQPQPIGRLGRLVTPVAKVLRDHLAYAGRIGLRRKPTNDTAIAAWMKDFDIQVASVESGLHGLST